MWKLDFFFLIFNCLCSSNWDVAAEWFHSLFVFAVVAQLINTFSYLKKAASAKGPLCHISQWFPLVEIFRVESSALYQNQFWDILVRLTAQDCNSPEIWWATDFWREAEGGWRVAVGVWKDAAEAGARGQVAEASQLAWVLLQLTMSSCMGLSDSDSWILTLNTFLMSVL